MAKQNLYSNVQQHNASYVPQFVGSTIEEVRQAATKLDEDYWNNVNSAQELAMVASQMDVREVDNPYKQQLMSGIADNIKSISQSEDQNFENAGLQISQMARDFVSDPARQAMIQNKQAYDQAMEDLRRFGPNALNFNPEELQKSTLDEEGNIQYISPHVEEKLDWDTPKEKLYDQMMADASSGKLEPADLDTIQGFLEQGTWEGITDDKVKGYLNDAIKRYKSTAEYDQEKRWLQNQGDPDPDTTIAERILATGREKIFSRYRTSYMADPHFEKLEARAYAGQYFNRKALDYENSEALRVTREFEEEMAFNEDGSYKGAKNRSLQPSKGSSISRGHWRESIGAPSIEDELGVPESERQRVELAEKEKQQQLFLRSLRQNNEHLRDKSDKELFELYKNSLPKSYSASAISVPPAYIDNVTDFVVNSQPSGMALMGTSSMPETLGNMNDVADRLGVKPGELRDYLLKNNSIVQLAMLPDSKGSTKPMYLAEVPDEDDILQTIAFTAPEAESQALETSSQLMISRYNGQPVRDVRWDIALPPETVNGDPTSDELVQMSLNVSNIPKIRPDGSGLVDNIVVTDQNGNDVTAAITQIMGVPRLTIDDIVNYELSNFYVFEELYNK